MPVTNYGAGADTSRAALKYIAETSWATTPPTPNMTFVRMTGESLNVEKGTIESNEIRPDGQIPDVIDTSFDARGGFQAELSLGGAFSPFFQAALRSTFATAVNMAAITTISAASADNSYNDSANGFVTAGIVVGQYLKISGFAAAQNNGVCRVVSVAAGKIVVAGLTLTTAAAGPAITVKGKMLRNGLQVHSFTFEKSFEDVSQFFQYKGMVCDTFNLEAQADAIATLGFEFIGAQASRSGATVASGTTAAPTENVLNTVTNLGTIMENDAAPPGFIRGFSVQCQNSLRSQRAAGNQFNVGIGLGRFRASGQVTAYFLDGTLYDKFLAGTYTRIALPFTGPNNTGAVVSLPRVKLTTGQIMAGGPDQDVEATFGYTAMRDPVTATTMQIDLFE